MRVLGLIGSALLVLGCTSPTQTPLDPFLGRTTVPAPGTNLAAPQPYYPESSATTPVPRPSNGDGASIRRPAEDDASEAASVWRGVSARVPLARKREADASEVATASLESEGFDTEVIDAGYEEDQTAEVTEPSKSRGRAGAPQSSAPNPAPDNVDVTQPDETTPRDP